MYYNKNGKIEHAEKFQLGGAYEGYNKKQTKWMYWLLIALVAVALVLLVLWFMKKGKNNKKTRMGYNFW